MTPFRLAGTLFLLLCTHSLLQLSVLPARSPQAAVSPQEQELLAVHAADRRAHLARDVDALLLHGGPEIVEVRDGEVHRLTREQVRENFRTYFGKAHFTAWHDLSPPVVSVSPDGRLGWMIVRVHVAYWERSPEGVLKTTDEVLAWMASYERVGGTWRMTAVTTTTQKK